MVVAGLLIAILTFTVLNKPIKKERESAISVAGASTELPYTREVIITAKQYSFSPDPLKLKLNEKVNLRLISKDVPHGFMVPELNIDIYVEPGKEKVITFQPTRKGTFTVICSIACGAGHSSMRGTIIVE